MLFDPLETERGTKSDSQIIMSAIGEVDLVASLQAQANWAPESLDATARVEGYVRITNSDVTQLGGKFGLVTEDYEAQLTGNKSAEQNDATSLAFGHD